MTSSIRKIKKTINIQSGEIVEISVEGRHDACIALRVPPVLEAMTAIVIVDLMMSEGKIKRLDGG
jgi:chorismate synthase